MTRSRTFQCIALLVVAMAVSVPAKAVADDEGGFPSPTTYQVPAQFFDQYLGLVDQMRDICRRENAGGEFNRRGYMHKFDAARRQVNKQLREVAQPAAPPREAFRSGTFVFPDMGKVSNSDVCLP